MATRKVIVVFISLVLLATSAALAEPLTVTMQRNTRATYQAWQDVMVENFEKDHPNIKIELVNLNQDTILTMIAAGNPPNIATADPYFVLEVARLGALVDLAPFFEREAQFDDWFPSAFRLYEIDGKRYAIPQDLQLGGVFYNIDAFQGSGVALPTEDWTFQDLQDKAIRLMRLDGNDEVTRYGFRIPTWRNWMNIVWGFGGDFVDNWAAPTRFVGNDPGVRGSVIEGLDYLHDLVESRAVQDRETHRSMGTTATFLEQKIAMVLTNTIAMFDFSTIDNFDWDVAPMPIGPDHRPTFINARGWMMFNGADNQDAAQEVLKYFSSPESHKLMVEMIGVVPPSRSAVLSEWLPGLSKPDHRAVVLKNIELARSPGQLSGDLFSPIQREADAVIWGEKPVVAALDTMETEVGAALAATGQD